MLKSLKFPNSTRGENPVRFPVPEDGALGTVTVLCGPNGAGKSFVLRMLIELIDDKKGGNLQFHRGWSIERHGDEAIAAFRPQHHPAQMNAIGSLSFPRAKRIPKKNDDALKLQIDLFHLLLLAVDGLPEATNKALAGLSLSDWSSDAEARGNILSTIPNDAERVYWSSETPPEMFAAFQKWTGSRIGLRREADTFEFVIAFSDGNAASYNNWSDGQKSLFAILASILITRPEVYLFDEIENFLHPQLMSQVLAFLKTHVRQTIIATHHPHLIFGNTVDEVYFIEKTSPDSVRFPTVLKKVINQPAPDRRITKLRSDQAKLVKTYRLFDVKDAAMMASAAHVMNAVDFYLNDAVYTLFECSAAGASPGVYVDRQSQAVAEFVAQYNPFPHSVLDWGAGMGRVLTETAKMGSTAPVSAYEWVLYDPMIIAPPMDAVSERAAGIRYVESHEELGSLKAGVALLTNVLHILPPDDWADAILDCWGSVREGRNGVILVTEVFPLLHPERQAVPLPRDVMERFFRELGFQVYGRDFEVHQARSYCLALTNVPDVLPARADLIASVEALWRTLHAEFTNLYRSLPAIDGPKARNEILNAAFGMATISSWLAARSKKS